MPMPMPNDGEAEQDFMDRCMANDVMNSDFPDENQRAGVCNSQWRKKHPKMATQPKQMKPHPHWLRASVISKPMGVDRNAKMIRGMVIAQSGLFKDPRGQFDDAGIQKIVELTNAKPKGLRSHFTHATLSSDGLGKFLGRVRNATRGTAVDARTGKTVAAARGDLVFDESAFRTPSGDLASYIMDLAESDPDALSSSLVIEPREHYLTDSKGRALTDEDGEPLPPIWEPVALHGSDIVSEGAAVDGLLSAGIDADGLPDAVVRKGAEMLDSFFAGQPRDVIEQRCTAWLSRYLDGRFPPVPAPAPVATPRLDALSLRLREMGLAVEKLSVRK